MWPYFTAHCWLQHIAVIIWSGAEGDSERRDLQGAEEYSVSGSCVICTVQQTFLYVGKTKEELDRTRGECGGEEMCFQGLGRETGRKETS
jgi:hypothetical protein